MSPFCLKSLDRSLFSKATTTTRPTCASSCVNQSWISSSDRLAKWNFDQNLLDQMTNTSTSSALSPTFSTGYVNEALAFNANANQSLTTSSISMPLLSFTIDAWIFPTGFPNTVDHSIFGICPLLSNYECLHLTIRKSGSNYFLYFGLWGDDCPGVLRVTLNEWIHVAFVFESNSQTQSIYMNGQLDVTRTAAGPFKANSGAATIGNIPMLDSSSGDNHFQVLQAYIVLTVNKCFSVSFTLGVDRSIDGYRSRQIGM